MTLIIIENNLIKMLFMFCIFGWVSLLTGCSSKKPAVKDSKRATSENLSKVESNPKSDKPKTPSKKASEKPKVERKKSSEKKAKDEPKKNQAKSAEDANKKDVETKSEKVDIASLMLKKVAEETVPKTDLESDKDDSPGGPGVAGNHDEVKRTPKKKEKAEPSDYAFN